MKIFLDTTVTFSDPFFKKNFNRSLLRLSREYKDIVFYMSEIVFLETQRHFKNNSKKHLDDMEKIKKQVQSLQPYYFYHDNNLSQTKSEEMIKDFDSFYSDLKNEGILIILECPNIILPELIRRSVNRIKPFKENKSEFRDAATWLTYVNFVEENTEEVSYFITENVNDFYDERKEGLHSDLLNDTTKLLPYLTLSKLTQENEKIRAYIDEKEAEEQEIVDWIEGNEIDENYVIGYFKEDSINGIFNEIYHQCSDYISSLSRTIFSDYNLHIEDGDSELMGIDIESIQDFSTDIIAGEIIVTGGLIIKASIEYLEEYRSEDERIVNRTPFTLILLQPFSFSLTKDKTMENLQLEKINKIGKAILDPAILF
ncbi:PIN domain-containing protein [Metabacillus idriensis]|uniref:PIN domain-containing protein n=1 Tax=Metabacillus idriensis TaxID=324768 RepID=UPI001749010E|nr:PIN domain-containing protein [Metabacillus idriensis]